MRVIVNAEDIRQALNLPVGCTVEVDSNDYSIRKASPELMGQMLTYYKTEQKLMFIKVTREVFGCGLKDAKDFADGLWDLRRDW